MTDNRYLLRRLLTPAGVFVTALLLCSACSRQPSYPPAAQLGANIVIDAASLDPKTPKFYTHQYQGRNISYFVLTIHGNVLSFLDACASCYSHKKGYRYADGSVTCRYCGMKFSKHKLEKGLGGCYPIKIVGRLEKGAYLIPIATLNAAADKF